MIVCR